MYCTTKQGQNAKHPQSIVAIINNESTTTTDTPYWPNLRPRICCCQNRKTMLSSLGGYWSTVSSQGNNQLITVMKQRKWSWTYRQSELKKKPTPVEPWWAHSKINIRHWSTNESLMPRSLFCLKPSHRKFHAFFITKWRFSLVSMTNEIKIASLKRRLFEIILSQNSNFCDFRFWPFQIKKAVFCIITKVLLWKFHIWCE